MYFANPWGLLGLIALPVIVVVHLYHRRYPTLFVAGSHLWGLETHTTTAGRTRERLPITATLICELLAALVLSLVLADPRWGQLGRVAHLVVVLDNSASMSAHGTSQDDKPFRDLAVLELERRVQRLPHGSVVTLLRTGRRPEMLAGPAVLWNEAKLKLANWQPALPKHDFHPTWDLAAQLAEGTGRLLFLTDLVPSESVPLPNSMEIVALGRALENVSISAARWDFDVAAAKGRVFARLTNHGKRSANVKLVGALGERTLFERSVSIPPASSSPLEIEVPGGLGRMTLEINSIGDGLALDNRLEMIEPQARSLHVAVTLPKGTPADRAIQRVLKELPDVSVTDEESAELLIGPADQLPPSRRELWWLGIGPLDSADDARKDAKDVIGPFVLEKQNPLLDGLTLGGIVWGGVQPVRLDVTPIVTAGNFPLLSRLNGTRTTAYLFNIDFARTNLGDSPDWPILLSNLIELRRENLPGLRRWNFRMNEEIRFRLADEPTNPLLQATPIQSAPIQSTLSSPTEIVDSTAIASETKPTADSPTKGPSRLSDNLGTVKSGAKPNPPTTAKKPAVSAPVDARPLQLVHNNQQRLLVRANVIELPPLDETGIYSIKDGDRVVGEFAIGFFDPEESTLGGLRPGHRDPASPTTDEAGLLLDQPLTWVILVGIVLTAFAALADWRVLRPIQRT